MKKCFFTLLFLVAVTASFAQSKMKISIFDEFSRAPITSPESAVIINSDSLQPLKPDSLGVLVIVRPAGKYSVRVNCPGYWGKTINGIMLTEGKTMYVSVYLQPDIPKPAKKKRRRDRK